jgi:hypothetical protein
MTRYNEGYRFKGKDGATYTVIESSYDADSSLYYVVRNELTGKRHFRTESDISKGKPL